MAYESGNCNYAAPRDRWYPPRRYSVNTRMPYRFAALHPVGEGAQGRPAPDAPSVMLRTILRLESACPMKTTT